MSYVRLLALILLGLCQFHFALANWSLHSVIKNFTNPSLSKLEHNKPNTLYSLNLPVERGDVLVVHAAHQVTTEHNLVHFRSRIKFNEVSVGIGGITTGVNQDEVGGNHHLPTHSIAMIKVTETQQAILSYEITAQDVSRKNHGFSYADPLPPNQMSGGSFWVERYVPGVAYKLATQPFHHKLGKEGRTFCCTGTQYLSVVQLLLPYLFTDLIVASNLTAWLNADRSNPNILDGEQIASVITWKNQAVSGYLGENVTRRNPVVSVFNETNIVSSPTDDLSSLVGSNFGNGAYFENAATNLQAIQFNSDANGYPLADVSIESIDSKVIPPNQEVEIKIPVTLSKRGLIRSSLLLNLEHQGRGSSCVFRLGEGENQTVSHKFVSPPFPYATLRMEYFSALNGEQIKFKALCNGAPSKIVQAQFQSLVYSRFD